MISQNIWVFTTEKSAKQETTTHRVRGRAHLTAALAVESRLGAYKL